jgi:hypothetical protein
LPKRLKQRRFGDRRTYLEARQQSLQIFSDREALAPLTASYEMLSKFRSRLKQLLARFGV